MFALRAPNLSGDAGLLHAIDERLAAYGFETNTGVKFVVLVDMRGRRVDASIIKGAGAVGLREGELKPVSMPTAREALDWLTVRLSCTGLQGHADCLRPPAAEPLLQSR